MRNLKTCAIKKIHSAFLVLEAMYSAHLSEYLLSLCMLCASSAMSPEKLGTNRRLVLFWQRFAAQIWNQTISVPKVTKYEFLPSSFILTSSHYGCQPEQLLKDVKI